MTTKPYYECHITVLGTPESIQPNVESLGWTFSCINGDPDLGTEVKCYATRHYNCSKSLVVVKAEVLGTTGLLRDMGCKVLRSKIEKVLYDMRWR